jgi:glycosyltransferase involved in cell wall biosynthesis
MKIAVIFNEDPEAGGAFHQSLNAALQFKRVYSSSFDIEFFHVGASGRRSLKQAGLESSPLRETIKSKFVEVLFRVIPRSIVRRFRLISPRERILLSAHVDLVYFTSPNTFSRFLQVLRYFLTVYDLCHREFPEFPEVAGFGLFETRESYNLQCYAKAIFLIADSNRLKLQICNMYGVQQDRVLVMPYTGSNYVSERKEIKSLTLHKKYILEPGYLFYPAQFWAHKNHVRILQALRILKQRGRVVHVAFAGTDKGGRAHVENTALKFGMIDQVHFLGFVPSEDLPGLYDNSLALVMPTYFGPTNLPPLEAWLRGVPVIYSKHLSVGIDEGVLAIDPDVAESIAQAIEKLTQESVRAALKVGGRRCLESVQKEIAAGEQVLWEHLARFEKRRETWA